MCSPKIKKCKKKKQFIMPLVMNFFKSHHVNKLVRNKGKRQTLLAQWVKNPKGGTIYLYPNFFFLLKSFTNGAAVKQAKKNSKHNISGRSFDIPALLFHFSSIHCALLGGTRIVQKMTETDWLLKTSVCYEKGTTWGI